jgi:hypothetical protein
VHHGQIDPINKPPMCSHERWIVHAVETHRNCAAAVPRWDANWPRIAFCQPPEFNHATLAGCWQFMQNPVDGLLPNERRSRSERSEGELT